MAPKHDTYMYIQYVLSHAPRNILVAADVAFPYVFRHAKTPHFRMTVVVCACVFRRTYKNTAFPHIYVLGSMRVHFSTYIRKQSDANVHLLFLWCSFCLVYSHLVTYSAVDLYVGLTSCPVLFIYHIVSLSRQRVAEAAGDLRVRRVGALRLSPQHGQGRARD